MQEPGDREDVGWLTAWGTLVPEDMSRMDMAGSILGMMSGEDMDKPMNASGAEFDQMFLTMMIEHPQGAIAMAKTE